jgi:predicted metal-dependent TIM-barrel fold hydrolase
MSLQVFTLLLQIKECVLLLQKRYPEQVNKQLAVPKTMQAMRQRGWTSEMIQRVAWDNPRRFMGQCEKFKL